MSQTKINNIDIRKPLVGEDVTLGSGISVLNSNSGTNNLGSPALPFNALYANNVFVSGGTIGDGLFVKITGSTMTGSLTLGTGSSLLSNGSGVSNVGDPSKPFLNAYIKNLSVGVVSADFISGNAENIFVHSTGDDITGNLVFSNSSDILLGSGSNVVPTTSGNSDLGSAANPFRRLFALDVASSTGAFVLLAGDTMTGDLNIETRLNVGTGNSLAGTNSVVFGGFNTATGTFSFAGGNVSSSLGRASFSFGTGTISAGDFSHAEGESTVASGSASHVEGNGSMSIGNGSHAEGFSYSFGEFSHSEGGSNSLPPMAWGNYSHAEGENTVASGSASHAEGTTTTAFGNSSHSEGSATFSYADFSHAEGTATIASGIASHAEGNSSIAEMDYSHAEGDSSEAREVAAHAEGQGSVAFGIASHAEGDGTESWLNGSHSEGQGTFASGNGAHAEGIGTRAEGSSAHAEGTNTEALNTGAHCEGNQSSAVGMFSHAEGDHTSGIGFAAHAEGADNQAIGDFSHVQGRNNFAVGVSSHAQGNSNLAVGDYSFVGGFSSIASGNYSFAFGQLANSGPQEGNVIFTDSQSFETVNDTGNSIKLRFQNGLNLVRGFGGSNDGVNYNIIQSTGQTANTTAVTIQSISIPNDSVALVEARILGVRISGIAGAIGDSATYIRVGRYKNISGTLTVHDVDDNYTSEDVVGWDGSLDVAGTNAIVVVSGESNVTINWHTTTKVQKLL